jgi:hypothetical protein
VRAHTPAHGSLAVCCSLLEEYVHSGGWWGDLKSLLKSMSLMGLSHRQAVAPQRAVSQNLLVTESVLFY